MKSTGTGLLGFLEEHRQVRPVSFHMPGHKGSRIYFENGYGDFMKNAMDYDITEIPGADNLFQTEGVIAETMEKYRKLYEVKKSYLLINGSSGGIISAILASVSRGGKLVMARNCHKSVFNAIYLGGMKPVYARPDVEKEYGILGGISSQEIARCLDENPDAEAVILPSPNYYGICSDIKAIAHEVHARGKILIVDQAHGAHLKFFHKTLGEENTYPLTAEEQGADLVINSTHKTLASWTQTAILNVCSDRVDLQGLEDKLQAIESSSPSYPLMASLDINADILNRNGDKLMREWDENLKEFYQKAQTIDKISLITLPTIDKTKINIDLSEAGITGLEAEKYLMTKGIFVELVTGNILMCMSGIGNSREDYARLVEALAELTQSIDDEVPKSQEKECAKGKFAGILTKQLKISDVPVEKEKVKLEGAEGRVCASSVIPYPPGVPMVCPGEIFDGDIIEYIRTLREAGEKVIGVDGECMVTVGK